MALNNSCRCRGNVFIPAVPGGIYGNPPSFPDGIKGALAVGIMD